MSTLARLLRTSPVGRRFYLSILLIAAGLGGGSDYLHARWFNARPYYTYVGTRGPFAATLGPDGRCADADEAQPKTRFSPGECLAWVSNVSVEPGVGAHGEFQLVLLDAHGERVLFTNDTLLPPGERRTGDKAYFVRIPADAVAGDYQVRRHATFLPPFGPPVRESFPAVPLHVGPEDRP